jgi:hypothetical protein
MEGRKALILAGTGLLNDVAEHLVGDGWRVVLPSRRPNPIATGEVRPGAAALRALRPRGHRPTTTAERPGRAIWVPAEWVRPRELAREAGMALGGPAELLVAWVHESYRRSVLGAVEHLLAPHAPVVEIRDGTGIGAGEDEPLLIQHPTQRVLLGPVSERDSQRSLGQAEMAEGVLEAVHRALDGHPPSLHQIGQPRPLVR